MEAELLQLAREAVAALQLQAAAANSTRWVEVIQAVASVVGLGCIVVGLFQMQAAGTRRTREIDMMSKALERQGDVLAELLRRTA